MHSIPDTFAALGDPTRLAIVEQLLDEGECAVGDIASRFPISMPAVSRHLKVLERAGLIDRRADRQFRYCRVNLAALARMDGWVERHRAFWSGAFARLDRLMKEKEQAASGKADREPGKGRKP